MSMYAMIHGQRPDGPALVALLLARQSFEVGRYRDAWVEIEGDAPVIRVHTRNGGGNREDYDDGSMAEHPWYVRDADDDYDCTYADWWFRPPLDELPEDVARILIDLAEPPVDMRARWEAAIKAIGGES
ncbi:MAG: Geobacillus virus [Actinomycetota bacterium]|jgi:hypothetical protein